MSCLSVIFGLGCDSVRTADVDTVSMVDEPCQDGDCVAGVPSSGSATMSNSGSVVGSHPEDGLFFREKTRTGVIRWDYWYEGSPTIQKLATEDWRTSEWYYRIPSFTNTLDDGSVTVHGDAQETIDQEIVHAKNGGIDYFIFHYYHPLDWYGAPADPDMPEGVNFSYENYLVSPYRSLVNYALMVGVSNLGPLADWEETVDFYVENFQRPNYERVAGTRPILYMPFMDWWEGLWGGTEAAREKIDLIRSEAIAAGLGNPYIVLMSFYPDDVEHTAGAPSSRDLFDAMGFDAISTYANPLGNNGTEFDYDVCANQDWLYIDQATSNGFTVVPTVTTGWDYRPIAGDNAVYVERSETPDYCLYRGATELAEHYREVKEWTEQNPSTAESGHIVIYAWNEFAEGGWLAPSLFEGTARLDNMMRGKREIRSRVVFGLSLG